jgi:hypothetical protein
MGARRASFWIAVGGVSLLANFMAEVFAQRYPSLGFSRFVAFTHNGKG